jgi:hypothetical protein
MTPKKCRVAILVKALPQPSKRYGETVCCAGVTAQGDWKRLFPIRFRHLQGTSSFARWDWVSFQYSRPVTDLRAESCHVHEETIVIDGQLPQKERARLLQAIVVGSATHAAQLGRSLALIRPRNTRFVVKPRSIVELDKQRDAFKRAASQTQMFDKELAELEPSPYEFRFRFEDDAGKHDYESGDWETHAMFWRQRQKTGEQDAIRWMMQTFNDEYPQKGIAFAIGNQAKRPQTWQLLGVLRLDDPKQGELDL